jgi:phosphoesterase RecJ-like protein
MLDRLATFLDAPSRILLTSHENPDGDGLGAAIGLLHYLRCKGKEVRIVVFPHVSPELLWLDPENLIEAYEPETRHRELATWPDAWLLVDASEPHRLGPLQAAFNATSARTACLDHHLKDAPQGFAEEFTDPGASASAELVYDLAAAHLQRPWPIAMQEALYAGVVADTGNFQFSNSTAKVHRLAADLIEQGVLPARIYQKLYWQERPEKLRLFGRAFESLQMLEGGRYARLTVTLADLAACAANHDDLDRLVNKPLELKGVEVSALLYESAEGRVKCSLRSRERVDVNAVARRFAGGGHRLASGAKLPGPICRAVEAVDQAVIEQCRTDLPVP